MPFYMDGYFKNTLCFLHTILQELSNHPISLLRNMIKICELLRVDRSAYS